MVGSFTVVSLPKFDDGGLVKCIFIPSYDRMNNTDSRTGKQSQKTGNDISKQDKKYMYTNKDRWYDGNTSAVIH